MTHAIQVWSQAIRTLYEFNKGRERLVTSLIFFFGYPQLTSNRCLTLVIFRVGKICTEVPGMISTIPKIDIRSPTTWTPTAADPAGEGWETNWRRSSLVPHGCERRDFLQVKCAEDSVWTICQFCRGSVLKVYSFCEMTNGYWRAKRRSLRLMDRVWKTYCIFMGSRWEVLFDPVSQNMRGGRAFAERTCQHQFKI